MITYFVTGAHRYTMDMYLDAWGVDLRPMIQVRPYSDLASVQWLPGGTYIFSDLERLTPGLSTLAAELWNQLAVVGPSVRLFNHPGQVLRRVELLRALHEAGRNDFKIYSVYEDRTKIRFPVFVRGANDHEGSRTNLLHTHEAIDSNLCAAICYGHDPRELLVVEYLHNADSGGMFQKFGAFRVGNQIIPRHLLFSRQWMLKYADLLDSEKIQRELDYLNSNPHQAALRVIFDLAHVDYGRCDYALVDGRIQVWEINTNPIVLRSVDQYEAVLMPAQEHFATKIRAAYDAINLVADPQLKIPIRFDRALLDRMLSAPAV